MSTSTKYIIGAVVVIATIGGFIVTSHSKSTEQEITSEQVSPSPIKASSTNGIPGIYTAYTPEKLASATSSKILLFFHAPWCEECHELNKDITEHLNDIPKDVLILKVDYDTSAELKKKYGVTHQYTIVQVDNQGKMIKKFGGRPTLAKVLTQTK
jgi:thioredoxin-like negative regulator of GroEL